MGTYQVRNLLKLTTGVALLIASSYVMSATAWNYNLSPDCDPVSGGTYTANCNLPTNPDLALSGWSTNTGTQSSGSTFAAAKIYDWGSTNGLGVVADYESNTYGPHSVDNRYGTDAILLTFTDASGQAQKVDLESVKIGWNGTDNPGSYDSYESSDISILAYTGTTPPSPNMSGASLADLKNSGWTLVGHYGQVGKPNDNTANVETSITSSWWLISAYNAAYGTSSTNVSSSGYSLTDGNDYFKLLSVAGKTVDSPGKVSEPATFLLMGTLMIGMVGLRRRRQNAI